MYGASSEASDEAITDLNRNFESDRISFSPMCELPNAEKARTNTVTEKPWSLVDGLSPSK